MSLLRLLSSRAAPVSRLARSTLVRSFSADPLRDREIIVPEELTAPLTDEEKASGHWVEVRVPPQEPTLEWILSSPPPLHAFNEPPLYHECTDDSACEWHNPLAH